MQLSPHKVLNLEDYTITRSRDGSYDFRDGSSLIVNVCRCIDHIEITTSIGGQLLIERYDDDMLESVIRFIFEFHKETMRNCF